MSVAKYSEMLKFTDIENFRAIEEETEFIPLVTDEDEDSIISMNVPGSMPVLPLRNTVLFPGVVIPITVGREKSVKLIKDANNGDKLIATVAQLDPKTEEPGFDDMYKLGTVARIVKVLRMPDDSTTVIIQGRKRFVLNGIVSSDPYYMGDITGIEETKPLEIDNEYEALIAALKEMSIKIIKLSSSIPNEATFAVKNIENASFLINFICSNSNLSVSEKQKLLEFNDQRDRALKLLEHLAVEVKKLELKHEIQSKVKIDLDKQQKEFFLHQQMKTIQEELGGNPMDQEIQNMKKRSKKKQWNKAVEDVFKREIEKLQRLNPAAGEYSVQLNYLNTILDLPWDENTTDVFDLKNAQKVLDKDHYGLEKVKERILEHLAVLKLKGDLKSPILCLYGPPGVGKTSLGKSIAEALGRKYVRMSLGGLHDEAEIRGHRKTYIGAMPGRIIQNIKKAKSSNPVFILDEIDKVGNDYKGDPSSALLEVLDPEQNSAFYDNYLELEYDLSKVLFIATANNIATINPALRDRMEMIHVSGYVVEEKVEIARKHLVKKQLDNHGVKNEQADFSKKVIELIIEDYTRESGVRELDKKIAKITRNLARKVAFDEDYNPKLTPEDVRKILGPVEYLKDKYQGNDIAGVVTGLAWTSAGGDILFIETSLSRGKGRLTLTGNLGEVMKESAIIALEYLKAHADYFKINPDSFDNWNVHVHVPEGSIPKDGPSAGVTIASSLASAFTQRKVRKNIAMTGEITLRGKVLAVGGIKEKILAAKRASIKEIILPADNKKDIEEINELYIKGLIFHFVNNIHEVFDLAILDQKVKDAKEI
ncbi:MAG: endopeptidase La [Bacteroidetes bacterium GWF2_38_335]|nr:MAG: endopeptidase La [Bacteroidetes bacterium GWF2_38_335]OFY77429.1 MAG: endopeptidase La [Bacteroidetes bacterium RIFOXYA12_FULL_38_20]HBS87282.1 endopeptidase La [Bacteroidales bacterium]